MSNERDERPSLRVPGEWWCTECRKRASGTDYPPDCCEKPMRQLTWQRFGPELQERIAHLVGQLSEQGAELAQEQKERREFAVQALEAEKRLGEDLRRQKEVQRAWRYAYLWVALATFLLGVVLGTWGGWVVGR